MIDAQQTDHFSIANNNDGDNVCNQLIMVVLMMTTTMDRCLYKKKFVPKNILTNVDE